jgi:hypothetical protein
MEKKSGKISDYVREKSDQAVTKRLEELSADVEKDGYQITYGNVGKKTTYCLISKDDNEFVGFTFIRNIHYMNKKVGMLKALQQALARKEITESKISSNEVISNMEPSKESSVKDK